ncbi:hypothetical protein MMC20_001914 [Loxospora ochrophaea]|nr:hypothetical protein [Loxospora ochrophaea]
MVDPQAGTVPVDNTRMRLVTIHGRDFQQYALDHSIQFIPVDDEETDRLLLQHQVFDILFDNKLIFPPITNPRTVLDCGYGAASWAVDVAENYPDCTVYGIDISPHMKPDDAPDNFYPQVSTVLNTGLLFQSFFESTSCTIYKDEKPDFDASRL